MKLIRKRTCGPSGLLVLGVVLLASAGQLQAQSVTLNPGDNIQAAVSNNPGGTIFIMNAGVYANQDVVPKTGDVFTGQPGAIMTGSQVASGWTKSYYNSWRSARLSVLIPKISYTNGAGGCRAVNPNCGMPEDLFFDNVLKQRVANLNLIGPGKWYLDYYNQAAFVGDDPTGHTVEVSTTRHAFEGSNKNVTIQGLIIEKYAAVVGDGAVHGKSTQYWTIRQNEIRYNHAEGIRTGNNMQVLNNKIHHNGQFALDGGGNYMLIQGNEMFANDASNYVQGGGAYFGSVTGLTVRSNYVHDNLGPGLHTDGGSTNTTYDSNHLASNQYVGIDHEISYSAVIKNNVLENEAFNPQGTSLSWGAGIWISNSSDVEVYGNTLTNCMNGIGGKNVVRELNPQGQPYLVKNLYVHDNFISHPANLAAGLHKSPDFDDSIYTSWNNRYVHNTYVLSNITGNFYEWRGGLIDKNTWVADSQDMDGTWLIN
jgi:hypothetical protein